MLTKLVRDCYCGRCVYCWQYDASMTWGYSPASIHEVVIDPASIVSVKAKARVRVKAGRRVVNAPVE